MREEKNTSKRLDFMVRTIAYVSIALSVLGLFVSIMQNIIISFVMPQNIQDMAQYAQIPNIVLIIFGNLKVYLWLVVIFFIALLVSSIALLKRKNWARIVFIGLFSLGILSMLASIVSIVMSLFATRGILPHDFESVVNSMKIILVVFNAVIVGIFIWIIRVFSSDTVKQMFRRDYIADEK